MYLIGAIMAAQLAYYCKRDIPDKDAMIEEGKLRLEAAAQLMNEYLTKSMDL